MKFQRSFLCALLLGSVLSLPTACSDTEEPPTISATCGSSGEITTGWRTVTIDDVERQYYVRVPGSDAQGKPLVLAFHGTGGDPDTWIDDSYYNLEGAVGDGAWLVYPLALPGRDGLNQWDQPVGVQFFDEILTDMQGCFDADRVFATGHSSGGGMAHRLACDRGGVLRAVAPVSGILLGDQCIGQTAVLQIHGANDTLVPASTGEPGKDFWQARNGCSEDVLESSIHPECVSYQSCDEGFAVHWCKHSEEGTPEEQGHQWPVFAGQTVWEFFQDQALRTPSDASPDREVSLVPEGNTRARFSLSYPADLVGIPMQAAASFYASGTVQPFSGAPDHLVNLTFPVGEWEAGTVTEYDILLNTGNVEAGAYAFAVNVYMEGTTYPIPQIEQDYVGIVEIDYDPEADLIIEQPMPLELVAGFEAAEE